MPSAISPYGLRSRNTQPKDLINHFDLNETAQVKDQAKEYDDFKQAIQAVKAQRKGSCIARITSPIPQPAQSDKLSPRPQLQDFFHVVIPFSDVRSPLLNPKTISDDDAYRSTLNITAFNQDRAKLSEHVIHLTSQPTRERKITEILAVANPTRPQPRRRANTPAAVKSSPPPSPSSSELSSVNESILADMPEAFQHTASTAFTSSPSPIPKARRRRPRMPRGPRLGFFVEPANAGPPLFDYCAAVCQLREHKMRIKQYIQFSKRSKASTRHATKLQVRQLDAQMGIPIRHTIQAKAPAIKNEDEDHPQSSDQATAPVNNHENGDTSQAHNRATAQETGLEDEDEASSDGDPMDIDEPDAACITQPLRAMILQSDTVRARQLMRAMTPRPDSPLRHSQPTWHQVQPIPTREHSNKRKPSQDDEKQSGIQDILQTQAKKARKERRQAPTPTMALGSAGSWRNSGWRKGLVDSAIEAEAMKRRR